MSIYKNDCKHLFFRDWREKRKKKRKKGTGYFFCMNCPRAKTALFLPEKVACPLFYFTVTEKKMLPE